MNKKDFPHVNLAFIGGSSTYAINFPEDLKLSGVKVLSKKTFSTPFGESPEFKLFEVNGQSVLTLKMHGWRPGVGRADASKQVFWVLKKAGAKTILAEGGVGATREDLAFGDFFIPDDYIDLSLRKDVISYGSLSIDYAALAGPMAWFLAWLVDGVLVWVVVIAFQLAMTVWALFEPDVIPAIGLLAIFVVWFGYGIATEWWWSGQTLGKRFMKLRVVDASGLRLRPSQIVIRNLLRVVDGLPVFYAVGGLVALCSRRHQRLGDLAANTFVVRVPTITEPDLSKIMAGKFNSFRDHPHLESRLRQRLQPQEASVAMQALMRRDDFEPSARVALFAALAGHFKRIVAFPQEVTEGLTDEQYARNVVDSMFRKQSGRAEPSRQPESSLP